MRQLQVLSRLQRWVLFGAVVLPCALDCSGDAVTKPDAATNAPPKLSATDADAAWRELQQAVKSPPFPTEWQTNRPSEEDMAKWHKRNGELAAQAADKAKDFYTRFPNHPKAADARTNELELISTAVKLGNTNRLAQLEQLRSQQVNDKSLSEDERVNLRLQQVQEKANAARADGAPATLRAYEDGGWVLQKDFPHRPEPVNLLLQVAQAALQNGDMDLGRRTLERLRTNANFPKLEEITKPMLRQFEFADKPLQLKFKAADATEFDIAKLRGKVVLVDFWASWCAPCVAQMPRIHALYEKYHADGFEIVGINMDADRGRFEQMTEQAKMTWPHYFDGKRWENAIAVDFGVSSIPALWLVDKKGIVRDQRGVIELESKVEKLLAEKN
jgi:thiol-disulfide isomerase/thioredoxin